MIVLNKIKRFVLGTLDSEKNNIIAEQFEEKEFAEPLTPLNVYETRKAEIENSSKQIEGIFYILDGRIIPDYYSECLKGDVDNPLRKEMYHLKFYPNYMRRKYTDLYGGADSIPRGRVNYNNILIDLCYINDTEIKETLIKLYRLPENAAVSTSSSYRCFKCRFVKA